jgi:pantoate--beta-alanine ligase
VIHCESRAEILDLRSKQVGTVGIVPTMGALHQGHAALIESSMASCDQTWVSVFVNPTQFAPHEDFNRYPRQLNQDLAFCRALGVDVVFTPSEATMYPNGDIVPKYIPPLELSQIMCGKTRPHFFNGVCNVVERLFSMVQPTHAFFGNKDLQQRVIIERMVNDLGVGIDVVGVPIVRNEIGLALSSRNAYLSEDGHRLASYISMALHDAETHVKKDAWTSHSVRQFIASELEGRGLKGDYVEVFRPDSGECVTGEITHGDHCCVAFYCDTVRLIDNIQLM